MRKARHKGGQGLGKPFILAFLSHKVDLPGLTFKLLWSIIPLQYLNRAFAHHPGISPTHHPRKGFRHACDLLGHDGHAVRIRGHDRCRLHQPLRSDAAAADEPTYQLPRR